MSSPLDSILEGIRAIGGIVENVFGFLSKGRLDQTKAAELYYSLQTRLRELESSAYQLQLALTEKMMAAAPWRTPLALSSGLAVILVCAFNLIARSAGLAQYTLAVASPEFLVLVGLFIFVASGSLDLLAAAVRILTETARAKLANLAAKKETPT